MSTISFTLLVWRLVNDSFLMYSVGGDTDILEFELTDPPEWKEISHLPEKPSSKLEISTIPCKLGEYS